VKAHRDTEQAAGGQDLVGMGQGKMSEDEDRGGAATSSSNSV
jgi:hypothetical protein